MPAVFENLTKFQTGEWLGSAVRTHCLLDSTAGLYDLWQDRRDKRDPVRRTDLDIVDLAPWLGSLVIYDYLSEDDDYFCRLFGEQVRRQVGLDMTRHRMSDYPPALRATIRSHYDKARISGQPLLVHFLSSAVLMGEFRSDIFPAEKLILPISRTGNSYDCFLTLSQQIAERP